MSALLEIEQLTKTFGGLTANDEVSFTVEEGQIVGLIGPNGAGKTTLFNCVAGYYRPDKGQVRFAKRSIQGWTPERICRLGIARTFQIVRVFSDMSVLENVMVGAFARTRWRARAEEDARNVLGQTGLLEKAGMSVSQLTIADKKRLELARALATRPRLLMLDEVMAGLTPSERQEAVELIRRIRDEGTSILMVEHVMEVIMPLSQRVVVLDNGRKIAEGPPDAVVQQENVITAYLGEKYRRAV